VTTISHKHSASAPHLIASFLYPSHHFQHVLGELLFDMMLLLMIVATMAVVIDIGPF